MKLRTQLILSIVVFGIVLLIVSASIFATDQQLTQISDQQKIANAISTGASGFAYISNDYFLYQQSDQLALWESKFSSISVDLSKLKPRDPKQQTLIDNVNGDLQRLSIVFNGAVSLIQAIPKNETGKVHPELKTASSRLAVQNQALAFDSSVLSNSFEDQASQLKQASSNLIFALLGAFGVYFVAIYLIVFRRTFRSIAKLQDGTKIVGSGNLDYVIASNSNDEIGELSAAFNQMTMNLKTVNAKAVNERQRLYNVLETLPAYVILLDKDYCVPFSNKVFRERFGESKGRACYDFLFKRESPCDTCETYKVMKTNSPHRWEWTGPDGRDYDIYDFPFIEADGSTLILEMGIDITERKKLEKQLKDSERLAAIGATAGMVGHDIRNPLQAITGDLFLAKSELSELPENENKTNAIESLDEIQNNIDYINKIVADLQDFARPLNPRVQEINIKYLFNDLLAKNGVPKNIKVTVEVEDKAERIMADPDFLKRIAANLTLNAVQAMPNGGKLTIHAYVDGATDEILITVKDTGVGIPEDIKPKLFTPMITTKSKGQGFGLAVVKRMTEGLGGTVNFESTEGKGTTFIIRLPPKAER